jgi:dTDP-4-dehydrorhamnose 3,5-epimerase-like enzyme
MEYPQNFVLDGITLSLAHKDPRRAIYEFGLGEMGSLQYIIVSPNAGKNVILGQHYHTTMEAEVFIIMKGGGVLYTQLLNEQGNPVAGKTERLLGTGDRVVILPLMAHTFALLPDTEISILRSRPWDPQNPDLNPYPLQG